VDDGRKAKMMFKKPMIIAHRGYSARYPENTQAAFSAAVDAGADMIEMDVAFTRDREVVVIHDDTVDRTTSGTGRVRDLTLREMKELDAGSWFDGRVSGERTLTLEETILRFSREILLNIEIKRSGKIPFLFDRLETRVVEIIQEAGARHRVLISSFSPRILTHVKSLDPGLPLALVSRSAADRRALSFCTRLGALSWHPSHRKITQERVSAFTSVGVHVFPYTVNTPAEMEKVCAMGATGIITDDPALAFQVLRNR
jgi:glycerophosphoryl diester phosphodiesterase